MNEVTLSRWGSATRKDQTLLLPGCWSPRNCRHVSTFVFISTIRSELWYILWIRGPERSGYLVHWYHQNRSRDWLKIVKKNQRYKNPFADIKHLDNTRGLHLLHLLLAYWIPIQRFWLVILFNDWFASSEARKPILDPIDGHCPRVPATVRTIAPSLRPTLGIILHKSVTAPIKNKPAFLVALCDLTPHYESIF